MRSIRILSTAVATACFAAATERSLVNDVQLTPAQERLLRDAQEPAKSASLVAEGKLLQRFTEPSFRVMLGAIEGASELTAMRPDDLLSALKANLASLEYTVNFGLDEKSRRLNPGREAMDLKTIEKYGHLPTDWELKFHNSSLTENVSSLQWKIYDAAETGLYGLPGFADYDRPTEAEIMERPKYIATNFRRMDTALERYGAYAGVLRNDAVRQRALFLGADSGGWESLCNKSVTPITPASRSWKHRLMAPCTMNGVQSILAGGKDRPIPGVADHQMHALLANAESFRRIGGNLPRLMHQFLTPGAAVRPIEVSMYTEAVVFGGIRMSDFKVLVGSFPGLFGSAQGDELRAFCKRHGVPLAWGLAGGQMWPDEETEKFLLTPYEPFYFWEAGRARLLDPVAGWPAVDSKAPTDTDSAWDRIWTEAVAFRKNAADRNQVIGKDTFKGWWDALESATGSLPPLRAGDCPSADLCFGTYDRGGYGKECVCRINKTAASVMGVETVLV